jgi:DNA-binding transcriptional ArsR family regulator
MDAEAGSGLSPVLIESISGLMAALADPNRIALLDALRDGEANVNELAERVDVRHQTASHHIQILYRAGLVTRRREATSAIYGIEDWSAWWLVEQVARSLSEQDA